jgi:hypothetical protein
MVELRISVSARSAGRVPLPGRVPAPNDWLSRGGPLGDRMSGG